MTSVFETEVNFPQTEFAEFFSNPQNNAKWMDDLERIEPISGALGTVGSKYRFVPKKGNMVFIATIISRNLPHESKVFLEAPNVNVTVTGTFIKITSCKTKFISEEVFIFKGFLNRLIGFFAKKPIQKAHHHHMNDLVRYVVNHK